MEPSQDSAKAAELNMREELQFNFFSFLFCGGGYICFLFFVFFINAYGISRVRRQFLCISLKTMMIQYTGSCSDVHFFSHISSIKKDIPHFMCD